MLGSPLFGNPVSTECDAEQLRALEEPGQAEALNRDNFANQDPMGDRNLGHFDHDEGDDREPDCTRPCEVNYSPPLSLPRSPIRTPAVTYPEAQAHQAEESEEMAANVK